MHMQVKAVPRAWSFSTPRRTLFRGVRLLLAAILLSGVGYFGWRAFTVVVADQAYINAEIVTVRAPITGKVEMTRLTPGAIVSAGTPLFRVENPRFADTEAASELSRLQELVERLRVECEEAEVRLPKLEEILKHATRLHREKLMPPVQFLEEEMKFAVAKVTVARKHEQLKLAHARCCSMEQQVELLKKTTVTAPFDGVVWAALARDGEQIQSHETVLQLVDQKRVWVEAYLPERHAKKFRVGLPVTVRLLDGHPALQGHVETVRAGVGRIPYGTATAVLPGEFTHRRIAVRVSVESPNPFPPAEFFGVGRSVALEL